MFHVLANQLVKCFIFIFITICRLLYLTGIDFLIFKDDVIRCSDSDNNWNVQLAMLFAVLEFR